MVGMRASLEGMSRGMVEERKSGRLVLARMLCRGMVELMMLFLLMASLGLKCREMD